MLPIRGSRNRVAPNNRRRQKEPKEQQQLQQQQHQLQLQLEQPQHLQPQHQLQPQPSQPPPPQGERRRPHPLAEGLFISTPRSPMLGSGGAGRQLSPNFAATTRQPPPINSSSGSSLPPIRAGMPSLSSPTGGSRGKQALSPYSTAPQGMLPQLGFNANAFPRSPISPTARYRISPRGSPPLGVRTSPPMLGDGPLNVNGGMNGATIARRLGAVRSRGLDQSAQAAQRLTFEMYAYTRIASPAKLHTQESTRPPPQPGQ